jgi:hypothetical protein
MIEYQSQSEYRILKNNKIVDEGQSKSYYDGNTLHLLTRTPTKTYYTELENEDLLDLFSYPSSTNSLNERLTQDFNFNFDFNSHRNEMIHTPRGKDRLDTTSSRFYAPTHTRRKLTCSTKKTRKTRKTKKPEKQPTLRRITPQSKSKLKSKSKTLKNKLKDVKLRTPTPHPLKSKSMLHIEDDEDDDFHVITPRNNISQV